MNKPNYRNKIRSLQSFPNDLYRGKGETQRHIAQLDHEIAQLRKKSDPLMEKREGYLKVLKQINAEIAAQEAAHDAAEAIRCAWNA